ncbi:synaptopodin-2 [Osmerus eperlanus]|uniref:synaptopodin-2 n=1 Tax=Osmerus eperlanus TaxID=29151 RepID=UPI002E14AC82
MEPEIEVQDNNGLDTLSGSTRSLELYFSKSQDGSYCDETRSDEDSSFNPERLHEEIDNSESPQPLNWEDMHIEKCSTKYNKSPSENHENYTFPQDTCCIKPGADYHPTTSTSLPSLPSSKSPTLDPDLGRLSLRQSPDSFTSSLGFQVETNQTLTRTTTTVLTPTPSPPLGPKGKPSSGTGARGNGSVESPDEGGSREETPPAPVSSGMPGQAAEQAEEWESDRDLCRASKHRARRTRLSHNESQTEKWVKEAKSKCKRISRLLTNAPNPRNKGALLFKKRRQRVKKYTFVSYGTGQEEIESEDGKSVGLNFLSPCDSELEDDYSLYSQDLGVPVLNLNLNRDNFFRLDRAPDKMEHLPETKGKGVMMFAQRRQRIEDLTLEHEEMRCRGIPVEGVMEPEPAEVQNTHDMSELPVQSAEQHANHAFMEAHTMKHMHYEESNQLDMHARQVMNSMEEVLPKPLVPNRTAKPFSCFNIRAPAPFPPPSSVPIPVARRPELKFKVPVPVNTNPQVWSPTGDIIASRDERISVPAFKTGILPESKRRGSNKQHSMSNQASSNTYLQNKGERRSYIESGQEEDYLSLGAEACNFMQPRAMKLKNPPPVAPKPTINPSCPPWSKDGPPRDAFHPPRSPIPISSHVPAASPKQPSYQQQNNPTVLRQPLLDPQQLANPWARSNTQGQLQPPMNAWAPANSPLQPQPSLNSWSHQPPRSPVSINAPTSAVPHAPPASWNKPAVNSVASCPAKPVNSNIHSSKAPLTSSRRPSDRGSSTAVDAPPMMGRGAELFAKRQSRMEKFVVDADTVQANLARSPSPISSLPNTWRYSPNVRAPPPVSFNPLLAPFYPPAAAKQPPSTSPKIKSKAKAKSKPPPPKHLDTLDVMKHQPYQLDSSLFRYEANTEARSPSQASPIPPSDASPAPTPSPIPAPSPRHAHNSHSANQQRKPVASSKPIASVSVSYPFDRQPASSSEPPLANKQLNKKPTASPATHDLSKKLVSGTHCPLPTSISDFSSFSVSKPIAPLSSGPLFTKSALPMAPRPRFSAKKPAGSSKQWKPVVLQY